MAITYEKDSDGIVLLTLDMPDHSANVLNDVFFEAFSKTLDKLEADESATGAILISGKKLWIAGADIDRSFNSEDPAHFFEMSEQLKTDLRRLETIGKPVVAALNGTALGGGLEVALSCHYPRRHRQRSYQIRFSRSWPGPAAGSRGRCTNRAFDRSAKCNGMVKPK